MHEGNNKDYGPAKEIANLEGERKDLIALASEFSLEELKELQKKLCYTVEIKEGEDERETIKNFLSGIINNSNVSELESIRKKIKSIKEKEEQ